MYIFIKHILRLTTLNTTNLILNLKKNLYLIRFYIIVGFILLSIQFKYGNCLIYLFIFFLLKEKDETKAPKKGSIVDWIIQKKTL